MANAEHVRYLDAGVDTWNNWRKNNPSVKPDLGGAPLASRSLQGINLSEADLRSALLLESDLHEANLNGADLSGAYLHESNLSRVRLQSARLENTDLSETNLLRANLTDANLSGAGLWGAVLARAKLDGTSFERATLAFTTFGDADLRKVKGLQSVDHAGPSFLDLATIVRSCGQIPEVFLRGCGVPEQFITYARSLVVQPIEFYSCFISYSSHDQVFAELLHADLRAKNLRCWFAPEDLKIGDPFSGAHRRIHSVLRQSDHRFVRGLGTEPLG